MAAIVVAAASAASLAAADPAAGDDARVDGRGGAVGAALAALIDGDLRRRPRPLAAFPVLGPVGYGEHGARYGASRGGRAHEGQDVFAASGAPLVAVRDGVVLEAGDGGGRGNYVAIFNRVAR